MVVAGCLNGTGGDGDGLPAELAQVTIEFEGFTPDTYPGVRTIWSPDGMGGWEAITEDPGNNGTVYVIFGLNATTALDALLAAAGVGGFDVEVHMESMGAFVDSVDDVENGRDGHYWSYYVNGEYGTVAADAKALDDGDSVRWVFMGNPFG